MADTTAPTLTSLTLPTAVDVTRGTKSFTFTAGATDVGLGVDHVTIAFDKSWQDGTTTVNTVTLYDYKDSFGDGKSSLSQSIGLDSASGTYTVTGVSVFDKAGNETDYTPAQLTSLSQPTSFAITSNQAADTTFPAITSLTVPGAIDLTSGSKSVAFSAAATDTGTGVDHVTVTFDKSWQGSTGLTNSVTLYDSASSFFGGPSSANVFFGAASNPGVYTVSGLDVVDKAGHDTHYTQAQLTTAGIQTIFAITSNQSADTTAPVLTSLTYASTIDVSTGGKNLAFSAGATDTGLGIDHLTATFDKVWEGSTTTTKTVTLDASLSTNAFISSASGAGTYTLQSVSVYDKAGNHTDYASADLTALGVQSTFVVTDSSANSTVFVTAPTSVTEGADASFAVSVTLKDAHTLSGSATMSVLGTSTTGTNDLSFFPATANYSVAQTAAGNYTFTLPSITIQDDLAVEATRTIDLQIKAPGQVFDNGTDTTVVHISLLDGDQTSSSTLGATFTGTAGMDLLQGGSGDDLIYGLAGGDRLEGNDGNDYIEGGEGADTILGGAGNDHLYGQSASGGSDGADLILGGEGNDYIQGNAGADILDGENGDDRINGGADNDTIYGNFGNDSINGNLGNDTIDGGAGDDYLRGGQGDDSIMGGDGNDIILGDLGNDTIIGGAGLDQLTGGAGDDVFKFAPGDAAYDKTGPLAFFVDVITDFGNGADKLSIGYVPSVILTGTAASSADAAGVAQALLTAHNTTHEVTAVQVGTNVYLFWNGTGTSETVDSAVMLQSRTSIDASSFI